MLSMLLQDYFKYDLVYRLHHIYYSIKSMLNIIFYKNMYANFSVFKTLRYNINLIFLIN